jgi:hypothetical protein
MCAALLFALVLGLAPAPRALAAPVLTGSGILVRDAVPQHAETVGWRGGGRGWGHRGWRGRGYGHRGWGHRGWGYHRPYYRPFHVRPAYYGPAYYRPVYAGPRCYFRPARTVWTPYGWRWRPAARICRW